VPRWEAVRWVLVSAAEREEFLAGMHVGAEHGRRNGGPNAVGGAGLGRVSVWAGPRRICPAGRRGMPGVDGVIIEGRRRPDDDQ